MNINFPSDSGIIKLNELNKSLAAVISSNTKYLLSDIKTGTIIIIAKAIRDIVCSGSEPVAMSICLNIYKANKKYFKEQFELVYDGVEEAINQFNIPLANFSISLIPDDYNTTNSNTLAVIPTVSVTGELISNKNYTTIAFRDKGHMIYLIGRSGNDFASSEYLKVIHGIKQSPSPLIDINVESKLHNAIKGLIKNHLIISAHNISEGGLFFALLESAVPEQYGFDITSPAEVRLDAFLFSEAQGRIIVTVSPIRETEFIDFMIQQDFPFSALGHITKEELRIDDISYGSINEYINLYNSVIQSYHG
jgi:phosphoribosylformylglycinamidine synthase